MTTIADVARMRLLSQRLVQPMGSATEVVRHFGCLQGQDFPGSTVSVALRTTERTRQEVFDSYDAGQIVRSWPMRGTLFVLPAQDLGWMLSLTADGLLRATSRRREALGLDTSTLDTAEQVARNTLSGGGLNRTDLLEAWTEAGVQVRDGRGYHLIFHLAVRGIICQGPMDGTQQRFVLSHEWIDRPRTLERPAAVAELFTRYVRSHGPVPAAQFLWWTKLAKRDLTPVLDQLPDDLQVIDVDGVPHWVDAQVLQDYPAAKRSTAAPLLLPGFDEVVLGYGDRRAVLTAEQEKKVVPGGNGVFRATVVAAGRAVGTWQRAKRRGDPVVVDPFDDELPAPVQRAVGRLSATLPV